MKSKNSQASNLIAKLIAKDIKKKMKIPALANSAIDNFITKLKGKFKD